jgi:AcrR family transcriptional regulator
MMVVTKVGKRPSVRERLLAASDELFYRDGVFSTGIDAVIGKAGVARGSLYYIFGGKDGLAAAYLHGRLATWRNAVEAAQVGAQDADAKILAVFDALADYVSRPDFRGCPFNNAAAEGQAGEAQQLVTNEYRDWVDQSFRQLAADTGVSDFEALADALIVFYHGALATAGFAPPGRAAALTAKRIARLTMAAAKASSST